MNYTISHFKGPFRGVPSLLPEICAKDATYSSSSRGIANFCMSWSRELISWSNSAYPQCKAALLKLRGIVPKNLQNVAKGCMAPRPMEPIMTICGSKHYRMALRLSWTKCVNMVCIITPAVTPPSAAYIGFLHIYRNNSSYSWTCLLSLPVLYMKAWKCHFRHEFSEKFSD